MEGPSLVMATEELKKFVGKKIDRSTGSLKWVKVLEGQKLKAPRSWGKHLILNFTLNTYRIHFLMFGSYRINNPRENRIPKLQLSIDKDEIYFYSCAIKEIPKKLEYDWSTDLMSKKWDEKKVLKLMREKSRAMVCDVLMDQNIFSGLGNIMKNEILFRLKMHPETKVEELTPALQRKLVKTSREYAFDFYQWKKQNVLKKNWLIMRKRKCPICGRAVKKRSTGKLKRLSHYCSFCQIV